MFERKSTGEVLQGLALGLQPLLERKVNILEQTTSQPFERERLLRQLSGELLRAGLADFNQLLAGICRAYFRRHANEIGVKFELEDFILEVQMCVLTKLSQFDPQTSGFSTWFSACILPRVYSDFQRQINRAWGRPLPQTAKGLAARQENFNFINRLSLDQPTTEQGENSRLESMISSRAPSLEQDLLEQQCLEFFLNRLQQLRSGERSLLRRLYVEQEPQKTMAQSLGITPAAMSVRMKKLHSRLATLLGSSFVEDCGDTQFCEALRLSAP